MRHVCFHSDARTGNSLSGMVRHSYNDCRWANTRRLRRNFMREVWIDKPHDRSPATVQKCEANAKSNE